MDKKCILAIALLALALTLHTLADKEEAARAHEFYCGMVKLYQANKHLPPVQRPGWPPYKGDCHD